MALWRFPQPVQTGCNSRCQLRTTERASEASGTRLGAEPRAVELRETLDYTEREGGTGTTEGGACRASVFGTLGLGSKVG